VGFRGVFFLPNKTFKLFKCSLC